MVIVETAGTVYLSSMQDKASSERRSHVRGTRSHYEGMRRLRCLRSRYLMYHWNESWFLVSGNS
jgi:hypothetical protein